MTQASAAEEKPTVESHFGFRETPFGVTPDPRFLYSNAVYARSLAELTHGILAKKGLMLVTGEVGMGKTILLRKLMRDLDAGVKFIFISSSNISSYGLLDVMARDLGVTKKKTRFEVTQEVRRSLLEQLRDKRAVALLVDEAQNLSERALESLCSLSNLETDNEKLLQIVLVGQPELMSKLNKPSLRQIKQRIAIQHRLTGLRTESELEDYIRHRLQVAGYSGPEIFNQEALEAIWRYSFGTPRLINILCDKALQLSCEAGDREISAKLVMKAAGEFQLKSELSFENGEDSTVSSAGISTLHSEVEANESETETDDIAQTADVPLRRDDSTATQPSKDQTFSFSTGASDERPVTTTKSVGPTEPLSVRERGSFSPESWQVPPKRNLTELLESVKRSNEARFQKRLGLKWKIAGAFSALTLVLCALLGVGVYYFTHQALREQLDKRAVVIATNLSDASAGHILANDLLSLNTVLQKYLFREGVAYAFVQNAQGAIIAHTFSGTFPPELSQGLTTSRQRTAARRELSLQQKPVNETSVPVLDGQLGTVHVGFWRDAMTKEIQRGLLPIIGTIAIVALLGAILSLVIAGWIVRPITRLTQVAEKITRGDLQNPGDYPKSGDEIGDLARSLERMRASLKAAMSRLGHESA